MSEWFMDCVESIPKMSKANNIPSPYAAQVIKKESGQRTTCDWTESIALLDYGCCTIAERYDLYSRGQPRKATIIEVLARNTCIACIDRELRTKSTQRIDNMYTELHQLACSLLIEELYCQLIKKGHTVTIATEENLKYGKVDVFIIPSHYGLSLRSNQTEIAVEVKTGFSLSLPQLFRYMIDNNHRSLVLWRIRNAQVLVFEGTVLKRLLTQFMMMIVSRADRLLSNRKFSCEHSIQHKSWSPNQQQLQEAFLDFSAGVVETMPSVVKAVVEILNGEQVSNVENDCKLAYDRAQIGPTERNGLFANHTNTVEVSPSGK
jgi:hypothetical protein